MNRSDRTAIEHSTRRTSIVIRLSLAIATLLATGAGHVSIVESGSSRKYDGTFILLLALASLPTLIYVTASRNSRATIACGSLLLFFTVSSWLFVNMSTNDFAVAVPILAYFVSLALALVAAFSPPDQLA